MKKWITVLSIALLIACIAALPVAARGSREPPPPPAPAPVPAPAPTYTDVPAVLFQLATIPYAGNVLVRMQITIRTYSGSGKREFVGSPSFETVPMPNGMYLMTAIPPAFVERYSYLVTWSQVYNCYLVGAGGGMPPFYSSAARVTFTP